MSVLEISLILLLAAIVSVILVMFFGVNEVSELEWKKQKAVADLEEMRSGDSNKARQRIIDVLNDEGMK